MVENICIVCPIPKKFSNRSNLKQHMKTIYNGRNDQIWFGSSFLQLSQNEVDLQKTKVVVCNICKNEFTCQENLIKHEKEEHNTDSSVQCDVCNKSFKKRYCMLKHRRRVHCAQLYECEECGKKSKTKTDHERHSRIHERKSVLKPLNVLKKSQRYV